MKWLILLERGNAFFWMKAVDVENIQFWIAGYFWIYLSKRGGTLIRIHSVVAILISTKSYEYPDIQLFQEKKGRIVYELLLILIHLSLCFPL